MSSHILNTTSYTIRTKSEIITEVVGIKNAITEIEKLNSTKGVAIFFNDNNGMSANVFIPWAKQMNRLINEGVGYNGEKIA